MKTLKDAKVGETVKATKLTGEGPVKRRIMDMGITKGVEIYVRKVAPLGDPVEAQATTTMSAMKYPREWQQFHWRVKFRLCLAWSRRKISSRRLSAREVKPGIRDMIVHWVLWRW